MRGLPSFEHVKVLLKAAPVSAAIADETGRIPADSIWLNTHLKERQMEIMSKYLQSVAENADVIDEEIASPEGEDDAFNSLDEKEEIKIPAQEALTKLVAKFEKKVVIDEEEDEEEEEEDDDDEEDENEEEEDKKYKGRGGIVVAQGVEGEEYPHVIKLTLIKAIDLLAKDLAGTSDPFARIIVDDLTNNQYQTRVVQKSLNPIWEECFEVACNLDKSVVDIVLCDQDKGLLGFGSGSEFLGCASFALNVAEDGDRWYDLECKTKYSQDREVLVTGRVLVAISGIAATRLVAGKTEKVVESENAMMSAVHVSRFRANFLGRKLAQTKTKEAEDAAAAWHVQHNAELGAKGDLI
jgi:hypothetical protein